MNAILNAIPAERRIARKTEVGAHVPGFAGPGHTAAEVVGPHELTKTDPFVMLMDDMLDFTPGQPVGEPHPHAGLETVTFMLEGSLNDPAEGLLETGDVAWMTAARGLIHNEDVEATGRARILQLWVALPASERDGDPELQIVPLDTLPIRREPGAEARLYSGRSGALESPTRNRVPMTVVDFLLHPKASIEQDLPGHYRAFLYVVEGSVRVGSETIEAGQVGWLDPVDSVDTLVRLDAGPVGARALLYAGAPLAEMIVHRGPFVAGSAAELAAQFAGYRAGEFQRVSEAMSHAIVSSAPSRAPNLVSWVLQVLLAAAFLAAGLAKLAGAEMMVQIFDVIGLGHGFRIVTGTVEVVGAIGILIPQLAVFAALWLAATMVGATVTHLTVLPGSPVPALVLLVLCLGVAWVRRQRLT